MVVADHSAPVPIVSSSADRRRRSESASGSGISGSSPSSRFAAFSEVIITLQQTQELLRRSMEGQGMGQRQRQERGVVSLSVTSPSESNTDLPANSGLDLLKSPARPLSTTSCPLLLNIQGNIGIARMLQYQDRVQFLSSLSYADRRLFLSQSTSTAEVGGGREEVSKVVAVAGFGTAFVSTGVDEAEGGGNPLSIPGMEAIAGAKAGF